MYRDSPFGRCVHQEAEAEAEEALSSRHYIVTALNVGQPTCFIDTLDFTSK